MNSVELLADDHADYWTVHVIGPDDVHTFDSAQDAAEFVAAHLAEMRSYYPRSSDLWPMIRFVVSPPTRIAGAAS